MCHQPGDGLCMPVYYRYVIVINVFHHYIRVNLLRKRQLLSRDRYIQRSIGVLPTILKPCNAPRCRGCAGGILRARTRAKVVISWSNYSNAEKDDLMVMKILILIFFEM